MMNKIINQDLRQKRWQTECKDLELIQSQCNFCKYRFDKTKCNAFPERIPNKILFNIFNHSNNYPGDNGIRYEAKDEGV